MVGGAHPTNRHAEDAGSDREGGKATFPAVCGMDASKRYAGELVQKACAELEPFGPKASVLKQLAEFIHTRIS